MTPYIKLQIELIRFLQKIQRENPGILSSLIEAYCIKKGRNFLNSHLLCIMQSGFSFIDDLNKEEHQRLIPDILREQIDYTNPQQIVIRNLLGYEFQNTRPMGYEEFIRNRGGGQNRLRTHFFAQPQALLEGDTLSTGDRLLSPPREGGDGSVLLHLTGGSYGHWISAPACIPIALLVDELNAPPEIVDK